MGAETWILLPRKIRMTLTVLVGTDKILLLLTRKSDNYYDKSMKVTVDIPDSDLEEILFFTGESKKGPAIRKMVTDALMLKRRQRLAQKFISGEWGVDLDPFEEGQAQDLRSDEKHGLAWRD